MTYSGHSELKAGARIIPSKIAVDIIIKSVMSMKHSSQMYVIYDMYRKRWVNLQDVR